jgi:hypothetical protein
MRSRQRISSGVGLSNALKYLVGEKLLHFVEAAELHREFAQERRISSRQSNACLA